MRIMFDTHTKVITGVIAERVTSFLPPSFVGENCNYIDIDYDQEALTKSPLAILLERKKNQLLGQTIVIQGKNISFVDNRQKQYMDTVFVDTFNPQLHKDVQIYTQKAKDKGVTVEIDDIDSVIVAKIKHEDEIVGTIRLEKRGCCTYVYETGIVNNREFYPHYIGFSELITHLQKKGIHWLDMGGILKKDDDLNRFKKKWGKQRLVEVTWQ